MIDFNKPVQTRDGQKVRVLCTDLEHEKYIAAAVLTDEHGNQEVETYTAEGTVYKNGSNPRDLINVPDTRVVWVNMYPRTKVFGVEISPTKAEADAVSTHEREACIRVEYTVGQFDE